MATIVATLNAASPGTQADNVTTDANLTYKVYNDTDSYATAEAFGKHGTTGVTVSAGVVTITGVTEPSGVTAYKISSVDEAGNEAVLSAALGVQTFFAVPFDEDFDGTMDADLFSIAGSGTVWGPSVLTMTQANDGTHSLSMGIGKRINLDTMGEIWVSFDITMSVDTTDYFDFRLMGNQDINGNAVANTTQIRMAEYAADNQNWAITYNGVSTDNYEATDISVLTTVRYSITATTIKSEVWNGSAWELKSTKTIAASLEARLFYLSLSCNASTKVTTIDKIRVRNASWTGQYPT